MTIYAYTLTTSEDRRDALLAALATLTQTLEGRPGFIDAALHGNANRYRFEEHWQSPEAHDAAMDPTLKAALKAVMAELTEPPQSERH
jgi:quinol monooxygenase YgiN